MFIAAESKTVAFDFYLVLMSKRLKCWCVDVGREEEEKEQEKPKNMVAISEANTQRQEYLCEVEKR